MTAIVMQYPPRLNQLWELVQTRPSISLAGKQIAFRPVSWANPEEPLWQKARRRFRPFGRIFDEKRGLGFAPVLQTGNVFLTKS